MGEIADALRRARGQRPSPPPEIRGLPAIPAPASGPVPAPVPVAGPAPVVAPAPFHVPVPVQRGGAAAAAAVEREFSVGSVEPSNDAVILEQGPDAEACRHLALRLRDALEERRARSIAIVSA